MENEQNQNILRPQPRRPGTLTSPLNTNVSSSNLRTSPKPSPVTSPSSGEAPTRPGGLGHPTRSVLNLTSSALFGIYSPEGRENYDPQSLEASRYGLTPYGTGAQTPVRSPSGERDGRISRSSSSFFMTATTSDLAREAERKRRKLEFEGERTSPAAGEPAKKSGGRSRSLSHDHRPKLLARDAFSFVLRTVALFIIGLAYGGFVTQLQDKKVVTPVQMEGIDTHSEWYLLFWGLMAVLLGNALPAVDGLYGVAAQDHTKERAGGRRRGEEKEDYELRRSEASSVKRDEDTRASLGTEWNPIVRSIGAFVAVSFAIRRLPWQSTLQLSLTLALANPCIWYLIDRTRPGFALSSFVGVAGAALLLLVRPGIIPEPSRLHHVVASATAPRPGLNDSMLGSASRGGYLRIDLPLGLSNLGLTYEGIGVATWISSLLFCSAVCFGNIGRRLQRRPQKS